MISFGFDSIEQTTIDSIHKEDIQIEQIKLNKNICSFGYCVVEQHYLVILGGYNNGLQDNIFVFDIQNRKYYECTNYIKKIYSLSMEYNPLTKRLHIIGGIDSDLNVLSDNLSINLCDLLILNPNTNKSISFPTFFG